MLAGPHGMKLTSLRSRMRWSALWTWTTRQNGQQSRRAMNLYRALFFRGRPPVGDNISLTLTGDAAEPEWRVGCLKASYVGRQAVGARTWVGSTAPWMMLRIEM